MPSHDACIPSATAASVRPAPYQRAARPVVPYSTKLPTTSRSAMSAERNA